MPRVLRTAADIEQSAGQHPNPPPAGQHPNPSPAADLSAVIAQYATAIPPYLQDLIAKTGGADGPIGRQYTPSIAELANTSPSRQDPIGDHAHSPVPGIVHRYPDRVLLIPRMTCAAYCRFCFRKALPEFPYSGLNATEMAAALAYIESHPTVRSVILTGGIRCTWGHRLSARCCSTLIAYRMWKKFACTAANPFLIRLPSPQITLLPWPPCKTPGYGW